jgi:hypothetical protein
LKDQKLDKPFDITQRENWGKPYWWDLDIHIANIEQFIEADELQMALLMMEMVPGWYRDNYPIELDKLKTKLLSKCEDMFSYSSSVDETYQTKEEIIDLFTSDHTYPRADIIFSEITTTNCNPWIFEISPGCGWLPIGMENKGLTFNYFAKNLNYKAIERIKKTIQCWSDVPAKEQLKWLVCFECLEHCWDPQDIERAARKMNMTWDKIFLSTPMYTLGGGLKGWKDRDLGHVRTWTPKEFLIWADKTFPGYSWIQKMHHSVVLMGTRL